MPPEPKAQLVGRIVAEVAAHGLADRSLRDLAEAVGTSHRMLLYHFGSRAGLVTAIVEAVEASQRAMLVELAGQVSDGPELVRALWAQVSSEPLRPFVRLFFECVALTGGEGLTDPWIDLSTEIAERLGIATSEEDLRVGVAVTRGLLIDVLAMGDAEPATRALERFIAMWEA
jgi:AcrR family transcriptional regulator